MVDLRLVTFALILFLASAHICHAEQPYMTVVSCITNRLHFTSFNFGIFPFLVFYLTQEMQSWHYLSQKTVIFSNVDRNDSVLGIPSRGAYCHNRGWIHSHNAPYSTWEK